MLMEEDGVEEDRDGGGWRCRKMVMERDGDG